MKQALLQRHIEDAESRIQRGQRNVDHQRKAVLDLERDDLDATIAKALLVPGITNAGYGPAVIPSAAPALSEVEGRDLYCSLKGPSLRSG
jgi:hypothetical protein